MRELGHMIHGHMRRPKTLLSLFCLLSPVEVSVHGPASEKQREEVAA